MDPYRISNSGQFPSAPPSVPPGWSGGAPPPVRPTWWALSTIAVALKVIAWIEAIGGVLFAVLIGVNTASVASYSYGYPSSSLVTFSGFISVLLTLAFTAIWFIFTYASAEIILVLLAIEKNTRR
jgi:hypothetical protein